MAKNIILIMTDQQHFDSLGAHGTSEARTPNIDRLAKGGLLFKNHFVTNPVCSPSRGSIMTGKHISEHGLWANGCTLPEENVTIPQALKSAGYTTAHFGKLHLTNILGREEVHPSYGFDVCEVSEGDQHLTDDVWGAWLKENNPQLHAAYFKQEEEMPHQAGYKNVLDEAHHLSTFITDRSVSWLKGAAAKTNPFFLSVGYFDPHHHFNPCDPYYSEFEDTPMSEPKYNPESKETRPDHIKGRVGETVKKEEITKMRRAFHAMVSHIDACVGRIVSVLEKEGMADDTVILFTSDHGDMLGNHNIYFKGPMMFDDLLRVPFIVSGGGLQSGAFDELTSGVDILPTICSIADAPIPDLVSGKTIVTGEGELFPEGKRNHIIAEWDNNSGGADDSVRCIRTDSKKLVYYPGKDFGELYNLKEDPEEFYNRYNDPAYKNDLLEMKEKLLAEYATRRSRAERKADW